MFDKFVKCSKSSITAVVLEMKKVRLTEGQRVDQVTQYAGRTQEVRMCWSCPSTQVLKPCEKPPPPPPAPDSKPHAIAEVTGMSQQCPPSSQDCNYPSQVSPGCVCWGGSTGVEGQRPREPREGEVISLSAPALPGPALLSLISWPPGAGCQEDKEGRQLCRSPASMKWY